ncbi:uncharacterized protein LOC132734008 isoform X2 [Ruditapes philippinarum]|uniref:uncharacterized protein LOC132734008 isoform X2 n=1 Tax=Ruditapes philippinarum TaxID=129788 RepID=UPI00295ADC98|nr:uncharacterized protein LOC132734008 isoform X2 [Ruditapes philippinarum]
MEKVLEVEESEDCSQTAPQATATTTSSATAAQANTETDKEVTKPEESKEATTKSKAEQKTGKFDTSKGNKSKAHVEGKVKLGDTEMEPEPDENLIMQCQKCQQVDTLEALLDDDTEKDSFLDQPTVCLEHPDTKESMEHLKIIEEDVEDPVIETIENIQSILNELTENLNKNVCAEAKIQSNLNELETSLKVSPGLKMITPQEKTWLNLNNLGCFFRKQLNSFFEHFLKYQKYVFNPVHLRPEKPVLFVCPYIYNGPVLVIPWCMMNEIYRLLSLRNANIESEHPITTRLASDGFFSDNSGIVSCVFCGSIICDNLFLSQSHEELTTFLDSHCIQCMLLRRNNIPLDNYGSHFNLADLMASSDMQLIYLVPSGSSHPAHGARYTCPMARWFHDHFQEIVPSGRRLPQASSAGLPQPDLTQAVIVQQGPIPSDGQSVTSGNIPAVSPSTVEQAVVPASRTIASAVIPRSYVNPPPQSCHMSQQQMEEISEEQPLNGIGTGAGEEIIRGELSSNSDAHVGVEDNTRVDVGRQLPEPRVEGNFDFAEKTGTNRAEEDNRIITDICRDHGTGAEATARIRVPEMSDFDARMASFIPCRHQFNQTPQAFTIAGLFYTGDRDQVRCFMCGGCLDQWEEMDNPFLEHVRHYPQCEFIWNFVIDLQMHNDPLLPHVIDAFVMSSAGSAAAADGYTHRQIYNAVDRLIVNRDFITYENIIGMLRDMGESPRR